MASDDDDWGDLEAPRKRSGSRFLFCGLGCAVPLVLLTLGIGWGVSRVQHGRDISEQWRSLTEIVPVSESPEGWHLVFGFQPGWMTWLMAEQVYIFVQAEVPPPLEKMDEHPSIVLVWTDDDPARLFDVHYGGDMRPYPAGDERLGGEDDARTFTVNGRALPISLVHGTEGSGGFFAKRVETSGAPSVAVRLTPPGATRHLILLGVSNDGQQTLPLDAIETFLKPFDLEALK